MTKELKKFIIHYWEKQTMNFPVVAHDEDEARRIFKKMQENGDVDYSILEFDDDGIAEVVCEGPASEGEVAEYEASPADDEASSRLEFLSGSAIFDVTSNRFDGDIVITDPCYLDNTMQGSCDENFGPKMCNHMGTGIERDPGCFASFGFTPSLIGNTIYGDWSCTAFNKDTGKVLGEFCADSGSFCVVLLKDVKRFNPGFAEWVLAHSWCVTVIPDFHGEVRALRIMEKGETRPSSVRIEGEGNINFVAYQTGY